MPTSNVQLKNLVLLGIGHTNAHIVHQWATAPIEGYRLICISTFDQVTYSGMLPGALAKQFADDEMRIKLKPLIEKASGELVLANVVGLDRQLRCLLFDDREPLPFDLLSIGVGSMPAGWNEHQSPILVPIKPMQTFVWRLESVLSENDQTTACKKRIAIVGGGVASVEIAFCLQQRRRRVGIDDEIEIFTSSPRVADGMRCRSISKLESILRSRAIRVKRNSRVTKVGPDCLITDDGKQHLADCVIWATGASAPPVLGNLGLQTDDRGFIATLSTLQSLTDDRIFAVGDSGTIIQSPCPKAGVYAVRQCPILWSNLNARATGKRLNEFNPQSDFLKLLNTGDAKALLEYKFLTLHAGWCWTLKTWIDKRFIRQFQCDAPR